MPPTSLRSWLGVLSPLEVSLAIKFTGSVRGPPDFASVDIFRGPDRRLTADPA